MENPESSEPDKRFYSQNYSMNLLRLVSLFLIAIPCLCMRVTESPLDTSTPGGFLLYFAAAGGSLTPRYVAVGGNCTSWISNDRKTWEARPITAFPGCSGAGAINGIA